MNMCLSCNGAGRVTNSPYPWLVEVGMCTCLNDTQSLDRLEQQLQILDQKIEDFEKGIRYEGETLDAGGSGVS